MATRYSGTWSEATPVIGDIAGYAYQLMQNLKRDIRERLIGPQWGINYRAKDLGTVVAGTVTCDLSEGDVFLMTLPTAGTVTLAFTNIPSNAYDEKIATSITIHVKNPASGSCTLAWPAAVKWAPSEPVRSGTVNLVTIYNGLTVDGGTTIRMAMLGTGWA